MREATPVTLERVLELLSNDERRVSPMLVEEVAEGLIAELIEY